MSCAIEILSFQNIIKVLKTCTAGRKDFFDTLSASGNMPEALNLETKGLLSAFQQVGVHNICGIDHRQMGTLGECVLKIGEVGTTQD